MNHLSHLYNVALLNADECYLWIKTEWRFHICLGVGAVLLSLGLALLWHDPTIFTRSGALLTSAGVFMTYRAYFRRVDIAYARDTGQADRPAFQRWQPIKSKEKAKLEDRKAFKYGLIAITVGTLIWAYGDYPFPNWPSRPPEHLTAATCGHVEDISSKIINTIGLLFNIAGVILVFFFGFPQPTHEEGVNLGLENGTRMPDGRTVAEHDEDVRKIRAMYLFMSRLALGLIILGFVFQLWAAWK